MNASDRSQSATTHFKILFVDDEKIIGRYFRRVCKSDFEIIVADNPVAALKILEQQSDSIAIILTDQQMPGMTGWDLLREVRTKYPNVIRMISSGCMSDTEVDFLKTELGVFKYIEKPWDVDLLRSSLFEAMNYFQAEYKI